MILHLDSKHTLFAYKEKYSQHSGFGHTTLVNMYSKSWEYAPLIFYTYVPHFLQSGVLLPVFYVLHIQPDLKQTLRKRKERAQQYSILLFLTNK